MIYTFLKNTKFMPSPRRSLTGPGKALKAAAILVTALALYVTPVKATAQVSGGFDDTGHYQYNNSPSFNPSPGHDGYNQYQRQEEQMERYRQESLNQERLRERNADASAGSLAPRSAGPTYITPPGGGRQITCYPTFHKQVICN